MINKKRKSKNLTFKIEQKERICRNCEHFQLTNNNCKLHGGEIIQTLSCANFTLKQNLCEKCVNIDICILRRLHDIDCEELILCDKFKK